AVRTSARAIGVCIRRMVNFPSLVHDLRPSCPGRVPPRSQPGRGVTTEATGVPKGGEEKISGRNPLMRQEMETAEPRKVGRGAPGRAVHNLVNRGRGVQILTAKRPR